MNYWIHPDAETELGDAAVYYAKHASVAIAHAFLADYDHVISMLIANPQCGPHVDGGLRIYHFERFPYTVVYAEGDHAGPQVFAVAHQRRQPRYWADRTTGG